MHIAFETSRVLSIVAFLAFGIACVFAQGMVEEFERYGLSEMRKTVGLLEIAGALGLLAGYRYAPLTSVAALGLAVLMLLGVVTRVRVGDPWVSALPAFFLMVVNGYIFAVGAFGKAA